MTFWVIIKTLEYLKKSLKHFKFITLGPNFLLNLIKVDSTAMLNNGRDETNIC